MNNYKDTILKDFLLIERKYYDEENFHYKSDHFLTDKNNKNLSLYNLIKTTDFIDFTENQLEQSISLLMQNYRRIRSREKNDYDEYISDLKNEKKSLEYKIEELEEQIHELKNKQ